MVIEWCWIFHRHMEADLKHCKTLCLKKWNYYSNWNLRQTVRYCVERMTPSIELPLMKYEGGWFVNFSYESSYRTNVFEKQWNHQKPYCWRIVNLAIGFFANHANKAITQFFIPGIYQRMKNYADYVQFGSCINIVMVDIHFSWCHKLFTEFDQCTSVSPFRL